MNTYAPRIIGLLVLGLSLCTAARVHAQEDRTYRIGPGDVLSITFWQQPDLNQPLVKVRQDSIIALPVIGETRMGGLTAEEAADRIVSRISRYSRNISQALVRVIEFNSRKVYVTGQVNAPGIYTYEFVPDLWTVLRDARGPTETADLSRVHVVDPSGRATVVNMAALLAAGKADSLPSLLPGTTIEVPAEIAPTGTYRDVEQSREPIVYVTGGVLLPGMVPINGDLTIYDAIAKAGGFSTTGDPKKLHIVSKGSNGPVLHKIDLRPTTKKRAALGYHVQNEDFIIVGQRGRHWGEIVRDISAAVLAVTAAVSLFYLISDN